MRVLLTGRGSQAGRLTLRAAMLLSTAAVAVASLSSGVAGVPTKAAAPAQTIQPNAVNNLDCNGWSPTYKPVSETFRMHCTDPINIFGGEYGGTPGHPKKFSDNGHYVGHDEPSVRFESAAANSGNTMSYLMQLP